MSGRRSLDHVLETRGRGLQAEAFVVACAFDRSGRTAAFALGDGTLRTTARDDAAWPATEVHEGAVLALAASADGFLTGGDDGTLRRVGADGAVHVLASYGSKWVEHLAVFDDGRQALLACAVAKQVHVLDGAGRAVKSLPHPSAVTGMAFDARGKRIVASHYGGASLWFVASKTDNPRLLEWKGSHTGIAISPDGDSVVTAMQENALHGWRLSDGQHMRMSGYPAKTGWLSFSRNGKWLASSGAEAVVLWPFFGGGPMGKAPMELGGGATALCTAVACHPNHDAVVAGFADGVVLLADIATSRILPVCGQGRGPVSALAWSGDGAFLAFGTEDGFAAVIDFSERAADQSR